MAKKQKDSLAETAIKKAIDEVNQKIAKKERGEEDEEEESEEKGTLNLFAYLWYIFED